MSDQELRSLDCNSRPLAVTYDRVCRDLVQSPGFEYFAGSSV